MIHKNKVLVCFSSNKFLIINLVEKFDPVKQMRTHPSLINRQSNRLTIEQLKSTKLNFDEQEINLFQKMRKKKYLDLQKRIEREKKLQQVELAMEDKVLLKVKFN